MTKENLKIPKSLFDLSSDKKVPIILKNLISFQIPKTNGMINPLLRKRRRKKDKKDIRKAQFFLFSDKRVKIEMNEFCWEKNKGGRTRIICLEYSNDTRLATRLSYKSKL